MLAPWSRPMMTAAAPDRIPGEDSSTRRPRLGADPATLRGTRLAPIAAATSLVLAWGFAQRPYALPTTLTIHQAAGDPSTMRWLVVVTVVAVLLVEDLTESRTPTPIR